MSQIDIDRIWPNPEQPRKEFEQEALDDLARSIKRDGVIQPVVLRRSKDAGQYELIAGERRWRAAQIAGLLKVPAVVREISDDRMLEYALVENLQREDLNPIEAALAFRQLIDDFELKHEDVADRVGKSRVTVTNALRLLNLPIAVQQRVGQGELSAAHARQLLAVGSPEMQAKLADRAVAEEMSVRQLESIIKRLGQAKAPKPRKTTEERDPNLVAAEQEMQRLLGTKVGIVPGRKKGGRVEIHYYSDEELDRLYQLLRGASERPA